MTHDRSSRLEMDRRHWLKLGATSFVPASLPRTLLGAQSTPQSCAPPIPQNHEPSNGGPCPSSTSRVGRRWMLKRLRHSWISNWSSSPPTNRSGTKTRLGNTDLKGLRQVHNLKPQFACRRSISSSRLIRWKTPNAISRGWATRSTESTTRHEKARCNLRCTATSPVRTFSILNRLLPREFCYGDLI